MPTKIYSNKIISITDLKKNPMQIADDTVEGPVLVLNRNKPVCYCLSPEDYEKLIKLVNVEEDYYV